MSLLRKTDGLVWALAALSLAFGLGLSRLNALRLESFFSFEYEDSAIEAQVLYNAFAEGGPRQTVLEPGTPDHFWPIGFLLAPLYAARPSLGTWYALMCFSYGFCSIPIYLLARGMLSSRRLALLVALVFLAYPPLHALALGPVDGARNFALPCLVLALYFMHARRFRAFCAALLLACMCKEDVPLVVLGLAACQAWRGSPRRWWASTAGLAAAYLCLALGFMAAFLPHQEAQVKAFAGVNYLDAANLGSVAEMFRHHLRETWSYALEPTKVRALSMLAWPLLFLPCLAPEFFVPAAAFAEILFAKPLFYNQNSDYAAPIVPFVFLGLCRTLAWIRERSGSERLCCGLAGAMLALCAVQMAGRNFLGATARESGQFEHDVQAGLYDRRFLGVVNIYDSLLYEVDDNDRKAMELARLIPRDASVTASGSFLPVLSSRRVLYEFGEDLESRGRTYSVDFVLIDRKCRTNGLGGHYACPEPRVIEDELGRLKGAHRYRVVREEGDFILLRRSP